ncbi:MAG TPA: site-2 protease family protein [Candidatus Paceibacterota bacterium]
MNAVLQIVILIFSAILHEVAHGYVAYSLGDPTAKYAGRLTLNPLAHLDITGSIVLPILLYLSTAGQFVFGWAKPVPYNPYNLRGGKWGPVYVALAGPATNLLIAVLFSLIVRFAATSLPPAFISVAVMIVIINVVLAVFNLIPVPPLDGSKLLLALMPPSWQPLEDFLNRYQMFVLLFIVFFGWQIIAYPVNLIISLLLPI